MGGGASCGGLDHELLVHVGDRHASNIYLTGGDTPYVYTGGSSISGLTWSNVAPGQSTANALAWSGGGSQGDPTTPGVVTVNYVDAANQTDNINLSAVPEPSSLALLAVGQPVGIGYLWRRRAR